MPTVLRVEGFAFRFYSNDHLPAHVHCVNGDGFALVAIATGMVIRCEGGIRARDVRRAETLVLMNQEHLMAAWEAFDRKRREVR